METTPPPVFRGSQSCDSGPATQAPICPGHSDGFRKDRRSSPGISLEPPIFCSGVAHRICVWQDLPGPLPEELMPEKEADTGEQGPVLMALFALCQKQVHPGLFSDQEPINYFVVLVLSKHKLGSFL